MDGITKKLFFVSAVLLMAFAGCNRGPRVGAVCNDGSKSSATGRGACSHHCGVDHWIYKKE